MGDTTAIEWAEKTFNPWIGCTKVSPACDNCYAERMDKRWGNDRWVPGAKRTRTSQANWKKPVKWNRDAAEQGVRYRVFCASLADVFDNKVPDEWRADLWSLIAETPNLDWLLLTKRPQNIAKMLPDDWGDGYPNVWLGTTAENQEEADRRIPHLLAVPAIVRFLSCEPLLGPVYLTRIAHENKQPDHYYNALDGYVIDGSQSEVGRIHWVIAGGESGPGFRSADPDWFRSLRDQCADADVPFLFKQWEGATPQKLKALGRKLDGVVHDGYPR